MSKQWPKIPEIETILCLELDLISHRGNAAGLQSLISTKTPKTKTRTYFGHSIKIYMKSFANGATRLAFRGQFCSPYQTCIYFKQLQKWLLKRHHKMRHIIFKRFTSMLMHLLRSGIYCEEKWILLSFGYCQSSFQGLREHRRWSLTWTRKNTINGRQRGCP